MKSVPGLVLGPLGQLHSFPDVAAQGIGAQLGLCFAMFTVNWGRGCVNMKLMHRKTLTEEVLMTLNI